jgi:BlaI family penicillinase repressor
MGQAEVEVMKVLWQSNGFPMTSTDIRNKLNSRLSWKKSTVLTLIHRLVEKGAVKCEEKEVHYYTPLVSESEYVRSQTKNFLERIFDGSVKNLLTTLCQTGNLSSDDLDELKAYLQQEARNDV